jgi:hypothetical protein
MMQNGVVYELPMQEHPTTDLESSLSPTLPTPVTTDGKPVDVANQVLTRNSLTLQSITAILDMPEDTWEKTDLSRNKNRQVGESAKRRDKAALLPTVTVQDGKNTAGKSQFERNTLPLNAEVTLLPETNWGKFAPAIERWESLTRPAPAPTKPDGKDGNHRLSAEFTEWMMGLPEGWVTAEDIGLKRNDQLKACGNGVVPQQAELALRILLEGIDFESTIRGGLSSVLPTPTVMDQRDGKYLRTVAIKNLEKGVNRGLNLNNVVEAIGVDWQDGDTFTMTEDGLKKNDN